VSRSEREASSKAEMCRYGEQGKKLLTLLQNDTIGIVEFERAQSMIVLHIVAGMETKHSSSICNKMISHSKICLRVNNLAIWRSRHILIRRKVNKPA
jgi:hypothetical protein